MKNKTVKLFLAAILVTITLGGCGIKNSGVENESQEVSSNEAGDYMDVAENLDEYLEEMIQAKLDAIESEVNDRLSLVQENSEEMEYLKSEVEVAYEEVRETVDEEAEGDTENLKALIEESEQRVADLLGE